MGRIENSVRNAGVGLIGHFSQAILQFACRSVFIACLSADYLGVNGLFTNILTVLSLSDLGFSTAIAYSLYDPIAKDDKGKILKLMNLYKRVYTAVAIFVLVIGLVLVPFLPLLIADRPNIPNLSLLYIFYLIDTAASYLLTYKRTLIEAYQKSYICSIYSQIFGIAQYLLKIVFLLLTHNFIVYLAIQICFNLLCNIAISQKANKLFPYLKDRNNELPEKENLREIIKNTSAMGFHKLGNVLINSTDNILISALVGLRDVGLYSNYSLISANICALLNIILNGMTASIGNLVTKESIDKIRKTYKLLNFMGVWIYSFVSAALFILYDHFITLWIGEAFTLSKVLVFLICIRLYLFGLRQVNLRFKEAMGLVWQDRYKPLIESLINLFVSIVLGKYCGIAGIIWGTIISSLLTSSWVEPYIVYKYGLQLNPIKALVTHIKYFVAFAFATSVTYFVSSFFEISFIGFILRGFIVVIVYNISFGICFIKTDEFKDALNMIKGLMLKRCKE